MNSPIQETHQIIQKIIEIEKYNKKYFSGPHKNVLGQIYSTKVKPYWMKWIIKRKYGKHPEISIDIWKIPKSIYETLNEETSTYNLIPKKRWPTQLKANFNEVRA